MGEEKNKGGRPPKEFDQQLFEELCGILCTEQEICGIFHTSDKTLNNWLQRTYGMGFSEAFKMFSARGKMNLRRYQFKLAQKNASMAIWLGKQYLGQKDDVEIIVSGDDDETVRKMNEYFDKRKKGNT